MIFSIAWKNVWRNRMRSLIVMIAVTIGMIGGIFSSAVFKGMSDQRVREAIKYETSHIQIHHPQFMENQELQYTLNSSGEMADRIEHMAEVQAVSRRMEIPVMIKSTVTGTGVRLMGIDPEKEREVTAIYDAIYDSTDLVKQYGFKDPERISRFLEDSCGSYFGKQTRSHQIVIGEELAEQLKVDVKSKVVVNLQNTEGNLTGGVFRVAGIYRITNSAFENSVAFVKKDALAELTGLSQGAAHELAIRLNDDNELIPLMNKLKAQYPELSVMSWKDIQPELGMITEWLDVMLYFVMVIILLALGFGIVNTMLMVVMERVKELGMLMAIGMNRIRVFTMIMLETIFLSLTGGVIGMVLAALLVDYFGKTGINLKAFAQGFEAMGYNPMLYPEIGTAFYFSITGLIILTAIVASVYPAIKALKMNPAEALRIEL
ncbi:MAG: FtsX-like permease family protein [Bacteroidales bacterium]|nr:ABC transporter permease [Bacteroidales bacterium]MBS3773690.1 ABC transporter permease [Bacteroidales bacterium]